jgi:peptide-methionine (R)-S-oxide reductase
MNRRTMLTLTVLGGAGLLACRDNEAASAADDAPTGTPALVPIVEFSDDGTRLGEKQLPKVVKSAAEWRKQLSKTSFDVTRREDTEFPFTGATWNNHQKGLYRCICCDTALFSSDTKFESGTGWPSFWQPIDKQNIVERVDRSIGMVRTAVSCRRCDGHLGHVFDDGPRPTGLRYCMNSAAMRFVRTA